MMMRLSSSWPAGSAPEPLSVTLGGGDDRPRREAVGFRLVQSSGRMGPGTSASRMSRQFTAIILLDDDWELDIEAIAATAGLRFPTIGHVDARRAVAPDDPGAVTIDGAVVTLQKLPGRLAPERVMPPLRPIRSWNPDDAVRRHVAAVEISCGGDLPGLEGAEAYAAAVHFVATAACQVAPVSAVLWREGWVLSEPGTFAESAERILAGRMPLSAWVSFATIVPKGYAPEDATGMVTYGMRPFIGRELELAPRPGDPRDAWRCISRVARMALDRGLQLEDGQHLADPKGDFAVTVRERTFWLRRDMSAYVLVADDSVVDVETLKPRNEVA